MSIHVQPPKLDGFQSRLWRLAEKIETVPEDQFDMSLWSNPFTQMPSCLAGYATWVAMFDRWPTEMTGRQIREAKKRFATPNMDYRSAAKQYLDLPHDISRALFVPFHEELIDSGRYQTLRRAGHINDDDNADTIVRSMIDPGWAARCCKYLAWSGKVDWRLTKHDLPMPAPRLVTPAGADAFEVQLALA